MQALWAFSVLHSSAKQSWSFQLSPSTRRAEKKMDKRLLNFLSLGGAGICNSCRSRQELPMCPFLILLPEQDPYSNEYVLATIGVDTAENEPLKVWVWFN